MAITTTSLGAAMSVTATRFKATAATGAVVGQVAKVDNEYMEVLAINGPAIEVARRGEQGGAVVAHAILAPVQFGLEEDFALPGASDPLPEPKDENFVTVGADGVITVPTRDTTFVIMKGAALATSTFANPSAGQNGLAVTFIGGTDFAHVVTTVDVRDGTTGAHTTLTSPAFAGGSLTLVAFNAKWLVKSNNLFVIT